MVRHWGRRVAAMQVHIYANSGGSRNTVTGDSHCSVPLASTMSAFLPQRLVPVGFPPYHNKVDDVNFEYFVTVCTGPRPPRSPSAELQGAKPQSGVAVGVNSVFGAWTETLTLSFALPQLHNQTCQLARTLLVLLARLRNLDKNRLLTIGRGYGPLWSPTRYYITGSSAVVTYIAFRCAIPTASNSNVASEITI